MTLTLTWTGKVTTGRGVCSTRPDLFPPGYVPGSLNLVAVNGPERWPLRTWVADITPDEWVDLPERWMSLLCPAWVRVHDSDGHHDTNVTLGLGHGDIVEVAAREHLRTSIGLNDGWTVEVHVPVEHLRGPKR